MQRITTATAVKDKHGSGKPGFSDGEPGISPTTDLNALFFDQLQEEIMAVIEAAGMMPSAATDQVLKAINALIAMKASVANPVFTGNPTAPTPAQFDRDTSLATTAFVQQALGNYSGLFPYSDNATLTAAACGALVTFLGTATGKTITLPKVSSLSVNAQAITFRNLVGYPVTIAAATDDIINLIGNTAVPSMVLAAGHSLVVTNQGSGNVWTVISGTASVKDLIDAKAPIDSPALSGNPTAPTPAQFDNDTSLATTAFVQRALGNASVGANFTAAATLKPAQAGGAYPLNGSAAYTLTLPLLSDLLAGATYRFYCTNSAGVTIAANAADNMVTGPGNVVTGGSVILYGGDTATFVYAAGGWQLFDGTVANRPALALKAPLASPALTGTPTAPTAAQHTSSTQIATTEYVQQGEGSYGGVVYVPTSRSLLWSEAGWLINVGGGITVTLPAANTVRLGGVFQFAHPGGAATTIVAAGSDPLYAVGNGTSRSFTLVPGDSLTVINVGGVWYSWGGVLDSRRRLPDYSLPTTLYPNTVYQAPNRGIWVSLSLVGSYMNSAAVFVGSTLDPVNQGRCIFLAGDDINGNTKATSGLLPIPEGMYYIISSPAPIGIGDNVGSFVYESVTITSYPAIK